jgi:hypothetical protein
MMWGSSRKAHVVAMPGCRPWHHCAVRLVGNVFAGHDDSSAPTARSTVFGIDHAALFGLATSAPRAIWMSEV